MLTVSKITYTRFAAVLLIMLVFSSQAIAQRGQGRRQMDSEQIAQRQTEAMTAKLELTEEQIPQVKEINLAYANNLKEMREEMRASGDRTQVREKMQNLRYEQFKSLKKVLSKKQVKAYKKMVEEQQARMMDRRGNRQGQGPPPQF